MPTSRDQRPRTSAIGFAVALLGLLAACAGAADPIPGTAPPPHSSPASGNRDPGPPASLAPTRIGCIQGSCRTGQGSYLWPDGSRYIGDFVGGQQHGRGLLILPDGSSFEGGWRGGRKHGAGVVTHPDGLVERGEWRDGRFLGGSSSGGLPQSWPDLSKPLLRDVGGGERDAAVVIGLSRYAHVPPLTGATDNAADWYGYLVRARGIPQDRVALLLDEDATATEMRHAAEQAARSVKAGGTLWFVFAGHGAPARAAGDGLLVAWDAPGNARGIEARSLRVSELLATLLASRADEVQVLLDTGFSGRTAGGHLLASDLQPRPVDLAAVTAEPRLVVMSAARGNEAPGLLPGASRPAFGYLALGGLRGWADEDRDGLVTAGELQAWVARTMRALAPPGRAQRPGLVGDRLRTLADSGREDAPDLARLGVDTARR